MTHHTDAERAEFEAWWQSDGQFCRAGGGDYEKTFAYRAWQAARRAPAAPVPKGWKLVPDEANMTDEQAEAICRLANVCGGGAYGIYRAALAAAPQPPEVAQSNSAEFDGVKTKVAPVQLPEPVAKVEDG